MRGESGRHAGGDETSKVDLAAVLRLEYLWFRFVCLSPGYQDLKHIAGLFLGGKVCGVDFKAPEALLLFCSCGIVRSVDFLLLVLFEVLAADWEPSVGLRG